MSITEHADFAVNVLLPAASAILRDKYEEHCRGTDIDIQTKDDNSHASAADREAEKAIRDLIMKQYPDHGIWGEEYGTHQLDARYLWILDPLDGTREFLNKVPNHFGLLIGLFENGKPAYGLIHDPLSDETWTSQDQLNIPPVSSKSIKEAAIACTCLAHMFDGDPALEGILHKAKEEKPLLNCIGFARVARGEIDAVMEAHLGLHDIAAILPVLFAADCRVIDFDGNDYRDYTYDLGGYGKTKYSMIASRDHGLVDQILKDIQA